MVENEVQPNEVSPVKDDLVRHFIEKWDSAHPTQDTIPSFYNTCDPEDYREYLMRINAADPWKFVEAVRDPPSEEGCGYLNLDKAARIYDVGAGGGIMGELLSAEGFTHIEAGDASGDLLASAAAKGWYSHTEVRWFGQGVDKLPADKVGTFDLVVASGVWIKGHIPCAAMNDCHALLKIGGHFLTAMRSYYWVNGEAEGYKDACDALVA